MPSRSFELFISVDDSRIAGRELPSECYVLTVNFHKRDDMGEITLNGALGRRGASGDLVLLAPHEIVELIEMRGAAAIGEAGAAVRYRVFLGTQVVSVRGTRARCD